MLSGTNWSNAQEIQMPGILPGVAQYDRHVEASFTPHYQTWGRCFPLFSLPSFTIFFLLYTICLHEIQIQTFDKAKANSGQGDKGDILALWSDSLNLQNMRVGSRARFALLCTCRQIGHSFQDVECKSNHRQALAAQSLIFKPISASFCCLNFFFSSSSVRLSTLVHFSKINTHFYLSLCLTKGLLFLFTCLDNTQSHVFHDTARCRCALRLYYSSEHCPLQQ